MANNKRNMKFGFHKYSFCLCSAAIALLFLGGSIKVSADNSSPSQTDNTTTVVSSGTNDNTSSDVVVSMVPDNAPTAPEKPEYPIPIKDIPHNDVPKTEEPKNDVTKTEEPKNDVTKVEDPKTEDSKTESPKTDSSKTDGSKNDTQTSSMSRVQSRHVLPKTGDNNSTLLAIIGGLVGSLGLAGFLRKRKG